MVRAVAVAWHDNAWWMAWNLALAVVPLVLSVVLFRGARRHTAVWWLGAAAFLVFLPNAPYVLTDLVHLPGDVRAHPDRVVLLGVLPQYGAFLAAGLLAYVVAVRNVVLHLRGLGWPRPARAAAELSLHGLCAVGIAIGRFARFNSWDVVLRPGDVAQSLLAHAGDAFPAAVVLFLFAAIAVAATPTRLLLDEAVVRIRPGRRGSPASPLRSPR